MSSNNTPTALIETAREVGWTIVNGGKHWKLVPPGGLSPTTPTALICPKTPSDRNWWRLKMADLRRYSDAGVALADRLDPRPGTPGGHGDKSASGPQWLEPTGRPDSPGGVKVSVEKIGPDDAEALLARNYQGQRAIRDQTVKTYIDDMENGRWTLSNDAITVDVEGRLINGQHRLSAVLRSGTTHEFLVVRGLPTETYDAMDTGKRRSLVDRLRAMGEKNVTIVGSALVKVRAYALHRTLDYARGDQSIPMLLEFFGQHPGIRDMAHDAERLYIRFRWSYANTAALLYLFNAVNPEDTRVFIDVLVSGQGSESNPAMVLREMMLRRLATPKERRFADAVYAACWVKAWNAYTAGATVRLLKWGRHETFPPLFDPGGKLAALFGWDDDDAAA